MLQYVRENQVNGGYGLAASGPGILADNGDYR